MKLSVRLLVLPLAFFVLFSCSGGGGSSSASPTGADAGSDTTGTVAGTAGDVVIDGSLGLVSGGVGLVRGSGVDLVAVVGVSGTGLIVGVSGTGLSLGAIQDFGSVVINDETLNTDNAEFLINGEPGTQSQLRQGQQILAIGDIDAETLSSVQYRANIIGPLDSLLVEDLELGLATGTALAQQVEFDASTVYENTEFEQLAAGQLYEFSGILEDDELLLVTFIRPIDTPSRYQLVGEIKSLSMSQFDIGGLQIDANNATLINFEDNQLALGDVVVVDIAPDTFDAAAGTAVASAAELLPRLLLGERSDAEFEGVVDRFVSPTEFDVQHQPITTTSATLYENGDVEDLELDARVLVVGDVNASGILVAQEITFEPDDSIFVAGPVDMIDTTAETITVLSVTFDLRDLTDLDDFDALEDLQIGDFVELVGYLDGAAPVAAEIELEDVSEALELRGPAQRIDASLGAFDIFGVRITTDPSQTEFVGFEEEMLDQTAFFEILDDFDFVAVEWAEGASVTDVPVSVSLEDD